LYLQSMLVGGGKIASFHLLVREVADRCRANKGRLFYWQASLMRI